LDDYESDEDGAAATFADGRKDRGDILVGADGIHSLVRKQRVPDARTDTGMCAIHGHIPIEQITNSCGTKHLKTCSR
jgi:2-polyprenyl-6-methoxyphenol hydroxylase-like FAD-dependent oxidoreductase